MEYKIETRPTLWDVSLTRGAYSDFQEEHYFIHANDKEEAWYLFKEYWKQNTQPEIRNYGSNLLMLEAEGMEKEKFAPHPRVSTFEGDNSEWKDSDYDSYSTWSVWLNQLNVIEFKK